MSDIVFRGGRAEGKVSPPPSKSHTHRAIIMSALSEGRCEVSSPLISFDTRATMDAVRAMGAVVTEREGSVTVECESIHAPDRTIDVMNSGTTMRLMTGISSLFSEKVVLTGDSSIQKRPMGPLLDSLSAAGVECSSNGGKPPVEVRGPITGSELVIDGGVSSQFVSSLIMSSPLTGRPTDVRITGHLVSKPYIDITTSMMGKFGVEVTEERLPCRASALQAYGLPRTGGFLVIRIPAGRRRDCRQGHRQRDGHVRSPGGQEDHRRTEGGRVRCGGLR